jgi:hypothetical protein
MNGHPRSFILAKNSRRRHKRRDGAFGPGAALPPFGTLDGRDIGRRTVSPHRSELTETYSSQYTARSATILPIAESGDSP